MKVPVYKRCQRVYFGVTKVKIGHMPPDYAILGTSSTNRAKAALLLSDWCANEQINPKDVKIKSGYVTGKITNYEVYA